MGFLCLTLIQKWYIIYRKETVHMRTVRVAFAMRYHWLRHALRDNQEGTRRLAIVAGTALVVLVVIMLYGVIHIATTVPR